MIEFWVSRRGGVYTKSEGEPLFIPELPGYQFVVHAWDSSEYRVSEVSSGLYASRAPTTEEAITRAQIKFAKSTPTVLTYTKEQIAVEAKKQQDYLFQKAMEQAEGLCQPK
jgi:hypothetical protein